MAAPVITGTTPSSPITFAPQQTIDILILAEDPDNGPPETLSFHVADSQGNITPLAVTAQVADPLTYTADPPPKGWTVLQDTANPALFHVKAP